MNLVGTLAKVALGVMVTRGVGKMIGRSSGNSNSSSSESGGSLGGLGGLLGGLTGGGSSGGGLGDLLGSVLGGGQATGTQAQAAPQGGGLGGLLNSLGGGQSAGNSGGLEGLGDMLNGVFGGQSTPDPTPDQNTQAEILLRGIINAAKSDGEIDKSEQQKIVDHLGEVTQDEVEFVQHEMAQPLDLDGFVRSVPKGLEQQVYLMSLLGIDLDSQAEAQYLDSLARGLGISPEHANQIHTKVGVPVLYR